MNSQKMTTLSTLAMFDDLVRCQAVLTEGASEEAFLSFIKFHEMCRETWQASVEEMQRVQREFDGALTRLSDLETKLYHARRLLEMESRSRKEAENERDAMEKKMYAVRDLLRNDRDIKDETRDKLAFLNSPRKRRSFVGSRIAEQAENMNSTGSLLSDLSLTKSEDDFLDCKASKQWRKHRPSIPNNSSFNISAKRCRLSSDGNKRKSSSKVIEIGANDKIVASTRVSVPHGDGPIIAESIIEAHPPKSYEMVEGLIEKKKHETPKKKSSIKETIPTAPPMENESEMPFNSAGPLPQGPGLIHQHSFASKTFMMSDTCTYCARKIRFGSLGLKCRDCRVVVHPNCRPLLAVACVPQSAGTPTVKGGLMGNIADYTPSIGPMVPGLIVHCVNEIETRGLNEVGIYRVSGSERDVKALKERFLRGKGIPNLSNIDIHVLCGCVKDFLRSLKEPLIPTVFWSNFSNAVQGASPEKIRADLCDAIIRLPQPNRDTLAFLIQHFQRIATCPDVKMPLANIAKVFAPTIVGYSNNEDQQSIFAEIVILVSIMEGLLNIPTEYWMRFVNVDTPTHQMPENKSTFFGTPSFRNTARKERKFYATPPYSAKKK